MGYGPADPTDQVQLFTWWSHPFHCIDKHMLFVGLSNPTLWCMASIKGLKMDTMLSSTTHPTHSLGS